MNSISDSKLLLEELKRRNLPPDVPVTQTEPAPVPTETVLAPVETHPTAEEWTELLQMLSALYCLMATEYDWLKRQDVSSLSSMRKELTRLAEDTEAIRTLLEQEQRRREQARKKNGRRFSLRLPRVSLPRPSLGWLFLPLILVVLWVLWWSWGTLWNAISPTLT